MKTQKNYAIFNLLNGVAYMCLGETIIVLFAIKLNAPNALVAVLGAMLYFSYFMLPVGKLVAARVGAARSQSIFWTMRNCAALLVAASAFTAYCGLHILSLVQISVGTCLFYGLRAAGVVMGQPLIGDMSTEEERPRLLALSSALFYTGCMSSLLVLWYALSVNESLTTITAIIVSGACVGVFSTRYIRRLDESPAMIRSARRPLLPEIRQSAAIPQVRQMMYAMFCGTLGIILTGSVSILSIKRGYGVSDTAALYFSLMQFLASTAGSFLAGKLIARIGSRKSVLTSYIMLMIAGAMWLAAPAKLNYLYSSLIFLFVGGGMVVMTNAFIAYYLSITPKKLWVAASMLTQVVTSVGAGVCAMLFSSGVFKILGGFYPGGETLACFKAYFAVVITLMLILSMAVWKLPPESSKMRK